MPQHWMVFVVLLSTAWLVIFCILFLDVRSTAPNTARVSGSGPGGVGEQLGGNSILVNRVGVGEDDNFIPLSRASISQIIRSSRGDDGTGDTDENSAAAQSETLAAEERLEKESQLLGRQGETESAARTNSVNMIPKTTRKGDDQDLKAIISREEEEGSVVEFDGLRLESTGSRNESKVETEIKRGIEIEMKSETDNEVETELETITKLDNKLKSDILTEKAEEDQQQTEEVLEDQELTAPVDPRDVQEMTDVAAAGSVAELGLVSDESPVTEGTEDAQRPPPSAKSINNNNNNNNLNNYTRCEFSRGRWVYDTSYPLYSSKSCSFIDKKHRCIENGRTNDEFQKWRWQPDGCDLPRFNASYAKKILERLRNGRVAFVGDSMGRNQWESLLCLLAQAVPDKTRIERSPTHSFVPGIWVRSYLFKHYNVSMEYYRSAYLVSQGEPPPIHTSSAATGTVPDSESESEDHLDSEVKTTVILDQINPAAPTWKSADVILLNTGHWWNEVKTVDSANYFQQGGKVQVDMPITEAFKAMMKTVTLFLQEGVDPSKSKVFFRSFSPIHFMGGSWDNGGKCHEFTEPLLTAPFFDHIDIGLEDAAYNNMVMEELGGNGEFVNVTYLSDLRPDGHASIWKGGMAPSLDNPQDCSHWCLPGVPDIWNQVLFATLLETGQGRWGSEPKSLTS